MTGFASRILVPTDFSPGSDHAWSAAQRLATSLGAKLLLLHVLDEADLLRSLGPEEQRAEAWSQHSAGELNIAPGPRESEMPTTAQKWAQEQLEELASAPRMAGLTVGTVVRAGNPRREIIAAVKELGADLIVLSTHGRGGVGRLVYGSVADPVIRTAPCPVLVVRQP
jgi:nucleotide-binding universal stress UspA family protein